MISRLHGTVAEKNANMLTIIVGGVGFSVSVPRDTAEAARLNAEIKLFTYLAVRENALELYGFPDNDTLVFFELLLTVSGIGPKSALAILNIAPVKTLRSAIASGDASHLTKTTGIGTKKAEKIILELKDKIDVLESELGGHRETADAIDALQALGYSRREAQDALKKVPHLTTSTEAKIKEALKILGK